MASLSISVIMTEDVRLLGLWAVPLVLVGCVFSRFLQPGFLPRVSTETLAPLLWFGWNQEELNLAWWPISQMPSFHRTSGFFFCFPVVILIFYIPDANPLSNMIFKDFLLFYELWLHFFFWRYCFFDSRNYCIIQVHEYLLLWFFSKKFMVIYLTYRSLILFKWIFCIWCEVQVQIHSYVCECLVVSGPFAENTILHTEFFGITV